jgi:cGMP-dependent 3',5'-cyclic phosphodiesterase
VLLAVATSALGQRLGVSWQTLRDVADILFQQAGDERGVLAEITRQAARVLGAECASVFLVHDDELVARVFDLKPVPSLADGAATVVPPPSEPVPVVRLARGRGIAWAAVDTGVPILVNDTQSDARFCGDIDRLTGNCTRTLLAVPIFEDVASKHIVAVLEIMNKLGEGLKFDAVDMQLASMFATIAAAAIRHSRTSAALRRAEQHRQVALEIISYHTQPRTERIAEALAVWRRLAEEKSEWLEHVDDLDWRPRELNALTLAAGVFEMVRRQGIPERLAVDDMTVMCFILTVQASYRQVPYHNWIHAVTVAHFCHVARVRYGLAQRLCGSSSGRELERTVHMELDALFLCCLCHDMDHRGLTNKFQESLGTPLASLYSSEGSVMERHHLAMMMTVVSLDGCRVFQNLPVAEYQRVVRFLEHMILETDLAVHFKYWGETQRRMRSAEWSVGDETDRWAVLGALMTACDLSGSAEVWDMQLAAAESVYSEFFSQGVWCVRVSDGVSDCMWEYISVSVCRTLTKGVQVIWKRRGDWCPCP